MKPFVTLFADAHPFLGPMLRSLANRIAFEINTGARGVGVEPTAEFLRETADQIDDWREANDLPTSRRGDLNFDRDTGENRPDGLEIIHYAAKELTESRGDHFTLVEGEVGYHPSDLAISEVRLILESAARARRK